MPQYADGGLELLCRRTSVVEPKPSLARSALSVLVTIRVFCSSTAFTIQCCLSCLHDLPKTVFSNMIQHAGVCQSSFAVASEWQDQSYQSLRSLVQLNQFVLSVQLTIKDLFASTAAFFKLCRILHRHCWAECFSVQIVQMLVRIALLLLQHCIFSRIKTAVCSTSVVCPNTVHCIYRSMLSAWIFHKHCWGEWISKRGLFWLVKVALPLLQLLQNGTIK